MKLTIVGSSHGVPEANRNCSCTMIEAGNHLYFVDMGSSAMAALRRRGMEIERVKGIFITHMHGDHTNGLVEFVDLVTWYFTSAEPIVYLPMLEGAAALRQWITVMEPRKKDVEYRQTKPGVIFDDGVLKVTAIATQHCHLSHAYLLEAEGKRVLITGDLKNPGVDFPQVEGTIDLLVCESAHFSALDYLPVLDGKDIHKVCVTHYSPRWMQSVLQLKEALDERKLPMLIATDDLEICV